MPMNRSCGEDGDRQAGCTAPGQLQTFTEKGTAPVEAGKPGTPYDRRGKGDAVYVAFICSFVCGFCGTDFHTG